MNFAVKTPIITTTQSYSLVLRDIFYAAVMRMPFFKTFKGRKSRYYQITPDNIPYLGLYILGEDMTSDGDPNAGDIRFIHTLRLGFSVVIQNNDSEVNEQKLDEAFWTIMNGLWTDPYLTNMVDTRAYGHPLLQLPNPDNVRFEGVPRISRRHLWGDNKGTNETPFCELQMEVSVTYRTYFEPVILDRLEHIHMETVPMANDGTVPPADEVTRIPMEIDLTSIPERR